MQYLANFDYIFFVILSLISLTITLYLIKIKDNIILAICSNILSLVAILYYLLLDAADVALTEASVGACASSVILFITLTKIGNKNFNIPSKKNDLSSMITFIMILCFFLLTLTAIIDMPIFGAKSNISNNYLSNYYIENSGKEIGIKSNISSILASYRGFDTFGETLVILIGAITISSILSKRKSK